MQGVGRSVDQLQCEGGGARGVGGKQTQRAVGAKQSAVDIVRPEVNHAAGGLIPVLRAKPRVAARFEIDLGGRSVPAVHIGRAEAQAEAAQVTAADNRVSEVKRVRQGVGDTVDRAENVRVVEAVHRYPARVRQPIEVLPIDLVAVAHEGSRGGHQDRHRSEHTGHAASGILHHEIVVVGGVACGGCIDGQSVSSCAAELGAISQQGGTLIPLIGHRQRRSRLARRERRGHAHESHDGLRQAGVYRREMIFYRQHIHQIGGIAG